MTGSSRQRGTAPLDTDGLVSRPHHVEDDTVIAFPNTHPQGRKIRKPGIELFVSSDADEGKMLSIITKLGVGDRSSISLPTASNLGRYRLWPLYVPSCRERIVPCYGIVLSLNTRREVGNLASMERPSLILNKTRMREDRGALFCFVMKVVVKRGCVSRCRE